MNRGLPVFFDHGSVGSLRINERTALAFGFFRIGAASSIVRKSSIPALLLGLRHALVLCFHDFFVMAEYSF